MSADILAILLRVTLIASAALAVILVLRRPLRALFGAQVAYAFWLLAPIATLVAFIPARTVMADAPAALEVAHEAANAPAAPIAEAASALTAAPAEIAFSLAPLLLFVWLAGAFFGVLLLLRSHQRFMCNADEAGPAVVGILRPRIVLPADFEARYTPAERDLVVAHEQSHIAAFDAQINALAAFVQCLSWFNPLVHLARKALRIDQELACDARVMARHVDAKRTYAEAMLKTQLAAQPVPLGCQWPPIGAKPLKERITMLSRPLPSTLRATFGAALCAAATIALAGAVWIAQPPRIAYAADQETSVFARSLGRQLVASMQDGQMDDARELIGAGADVNAFVADDGTPLIIAARAGDRAMVEYLLERGANVNQPAPGDGNPLIMAAAYGHMDIVTLLIARGAEIDGFVSGDETPLINAAYRNQLDVARYLIERGADVNLAVRAPVIDGGELRSPMIMAQRARNDEMVRLLRANGATG